MDRKLSNNKENVSKRILETKRETERLKEELQKLIDSGLHSVPNLYGPTVPKQTIVTEKHSDNKVQIIKSYDPKHSTNETKEDLNHRPTNESNFDNITTNKNQTEGVSPKKCRSYNVEEAREYIRKQKEKRLEQQKFNKKDNKLTAEITKKKLQELQKKSLELVSKNIEAKRERSKSRERNDRIKGEVRPTPNIGSTVLHNQLQGCSREKFRQPVRREVISTVRNNKFKNPNSENTINKSTGSKGNNVTEATQSKLHENLHRSRSASPKRNFEEKNVQETDKIVARQVEKKDPNLLYPPDPFAIYATDKKITHEEKNDHEGVLKTKETLNATSNLTVRPSSQQQTQTDILPWFQEKPYTADPFNVINCVKRKLQYDLLKNVKPQVEVAVQSSVASSEKNKKGTSVVSKKENKNTDLRSFMSHKCVNLDPKSIEHLELHTKRTILHEMTSITHSDSESDTSKNIPDISSESGTSVKRNAERVKKSLSDLREIHHSSDLRINTEKIDTMKLHPCGTESKTADGYLESDSEIKTTTVYKQESKPPKSINDTEHIGGDINNIKRNLFNTFSEYSSDFNSRSLSKSRESIVSYNCAKISPNKAVLPSDSRSVPSENIKTAPEHTRSEGTYTPFTDNVGLLTKSNSHFTGTDGDFLSLPTQKNSRKSKNQRSSSTCQISSDSRQKNSILTSENSTNRKKHSNPTVISTLSENKNSNLNADIQDISKQPVEKEIDDRQTVNTNDSSSSISKQDTCLKSRNNLNTNYDISPTSIQELSLKQPTVSLKIAKKKNTHSEKEMDKNENSIMKNITLRSGNSNKSNQVHLKFEAEIHLLNDFNESLRHLTEVEKAFESLRSKNDSQITTSKILHNRDTQTSIIANPTRSSSSQNKKKNSIDGSRSNVSTINYTRGSECPNESSIIFNNTLQDIPFESDSITSTDVHIRSTISDSAFMKSSTKFDFENLQSKNFAGMSLRMFDQLIRDEDVRLENLKTIIKIREKALLDRTRAELSWLEIQRKHLKETGKLQEASLVKKKQRGILVKHQQERHEMQRLKQMQKAASTERKVILKEQRNLIKNQLSTESMLSKIKVNTPKRHRNSGPLKVLQTNTESVVSESSISRKSSVEGDVRSVTSHSYSVISKVLQVSGDVPLEFDVSEIPGRSGNQQNVPAVSQIKRSLLMREATLQKRRKEAEELLQWHKKLLEEEKRIAELESTANNIISNIPATNSNDEMDREKHKFKGKQLNKLWLNLTGCDDRKFVEDKVYPMSQIALERFCRSAREFTVKSKKLLNKTESGVKSTYDKTISDNNTSHYSLGVDSQNARIPKKPDIISDSLNVGVKQPGDGSTNSNIHTTENSYTMDFNCESNIEGLSIQSVDVVDQSKISSISQLIDNFCKIKDDISSLSVVQSKKVYKNDHVGEETERSNDSLKTDISVSDFEAHDPSVIETAKTSKEQTDNLSVISKESKALSQTEHDLKSSEQTNLSDSLENCSEINYQLTKEPEQKNKIQKQLETSDKQSPATSSVEVSNMGTGKHKFKGKQLNTMWLNLTGCDDKKFIEDKEYLMSQKDLEIFCKNARDYSVNAKKDLKKTKNEIKTMKDITSESEVNIESQITGIPKEQESTNSIHTAASNYSMVYNESNLEGLSIQAFDVDPHDSNLSINELKDNSSEINDGIDFKKYSGVKQKENSNDSIKTDRSVSDIKTHDPSIIEQAKSINKDEVNTVSNSTNCQISETGLFEHNSPINDELAKENTVSERNDLSLVEIQEPHDISILSNAESKQNISNNDHTDGNQSISDISTETAKSNFMPSESIINENVETHVSDNFSKESLEFIVNEDLSYNTIQGSAQELLQKNKNINEEKENINRTNGHDVSSLELSFKTQSSKHGKVHEEERITENNLSSNLSGTITTKEEINSSEEKEHDSMSPSISPSVIDSYQDIAVRTSAEDSTRELDYKDEFLLSRISTDQNTQEDPKLVNTSPTSNKERESTVSYISENDKPGEDLASDTDKTNKIQSEICSTTSSPASEIISLVIKESSDTSSSVDKSEASCKVDSEDKSTSYDENTPNKVDVKKRVSEILADTSHMSRGDKSPRLQDLYVTTYDLVSPTDSPESTSPKDGTKSFTLGSEAEELLKKQLEIEQEIKQITEQQQKGHLPYVYVREIPNKPPPPYTPPSSAKAKKVLGILPNSKEEVEEITKYSAKIIHKAYVLKNLENITLSENTLNLIAKNIQKDCYKFVFDLCKEIAKEHYKQFEKEDVAPWLQVPENIHITVVKPLDVKGLEKLMTKKLLEIFGFQKSEIRESAIIKWSRKKRDHVDEILVMESQAEETQWTNFDKAELLIMNEVTDDIMKVLLKETAEVIHATLSKKSSW